MEKHKVICPYCGAGCQFNLLVQNGQVVGTEPLNGITNQSELCLKGMSGYDFINDTKILTPRVLHPMGYSRRGKCSPHPPYRGWSMTCNLNQPCPSDRGQ